MRTPGFSLLLFRDLERGHEMKRVMFSIGAQWKWLLVEWFRRRSRMLASTDVSPPYRAQDETGWSGSSNAPVSAKVPTRHRPGSSNCASNTRAVN